MSFNAFSVGTLQACALRRFTFGWVSVRHVAANGENHTAQIHIIACHWSVYDGDLLIYKISSIEISWNISDWSTSLETSTNIEIGSAKWIEGNFHSLEHVHSFIHSFNRGLLPVTTLGKDEGTKSWKHGKHSNRCWKIFGQILLC